MRTLGLVLAVLLSMCQGLGCGDDLGTSGPDAGTVSDAGPADASASNHDHPPPACCCGQIYDPMVNGCVVPPDAR